MEENESEDSEYEMGTPALPVHPFDVNAVDQNAMPLTSQEYLQQVIAERSKLPKVVSASVPKLKLDNIKKSNTCFFPNEEIIPSEYRPSKKWQDKQISNFSVLRYRIECDREKWASENKQHFPATKEKWFTFLFNESSAEKECQQLPYLCFVLSMSNEMMERLIKYIVDWVIEDKLKVYPAGLWLFALLACIETPLCIKLVTRLRMFLNKCRSLREEIDIDVEENVKELIAQNLFICLIGKYFGQHDLSD